MDAGNLSWKATFGNLYGGDVDLDLDLALEVGARQMYSAWVCRPELEAQGGCIFRFSGPLTSSVIHTQHKHGSDVYKTKYLQFKKHSLPFHLLPVFPGKHLFKLFWGKKVFRGEQLNVSLSAHANCPSGGDGKSHIPHFSDTHDPSPPKFKETKDVSRTPLEK